MEREKTVTAFDVFAREWRDRIDGELTRWTVFGPDCPERLAEAVRYSLLSPGKRLRPTLVLLAAEICGGAAFDALNAACAVEMVHCYSLIHDDLPAMDDDDLRRGRPTCHKQFDEATAILAGDALLTLAFEAAAQTQPKETAADCVTLLAKAAGAVGMVGGQTDDVLFAAAKESVRAATRSPELLTAIHRRKTGAMIGVSLALGARIASADAVKTAALSRYGESFGLAFQITDDLLDATGDEKIVGKRVHKDDAAGKLTFPSFLGLEASRQKALEQIAEAVESLGIFPDSEAKRTLAALVESLADRTF